MALKKPTHQLTGEYQVSKMVTRRIPGLKECGDNMDRGGRESCFLAQKALLHAEARLKECREMEARERKSLDQQWKDLSDKEEQLRQSFIKFNQFTVDNFEKRRRAALILARKNRLIAQREEEINALLGEVNYVADIKEQMDDRIDLYKRMAEFLKDVVAKYPAEFDNIDDVLRKHASLIETQERLNEVQLVDAKEIQKVRDHFDKVVADYSVTLSGLTTKLGELRKRYEDAKAKSLKWEKLYESIRSQATDKVLQSIAIKNSCRLMYEEICTRKKAEPVYEDNYGKQFEVIKKALLDYECINAMVRAAEEERLRLSEKVCVSGGTQ